MLLIWLFLVFIQVSYSSEFERECSCTSTHFLATYKQFPLLFLMANQNYYLKEVPVAEASYVPSGYNWKETKDIRVKTHPKSLHLYANTKYCIVRNRKTVIFKRWWKY